MVTRQDQLAGLEDGVFDATIIGGGVNGACLYDRLCRLGYRVCLLDRADFGSGTSEASGMMIWGGLLYLRQFDLRTVYQLCAARDRLLGTENAPVELARIRYCADPNSRVTTLSVLIGLYLYWMLAGCRRTRPRVDHAFAERVLLTKPGLSLSYDEAQLNVSDTRFVLSWILPHLGTPSVALNYCAVTGGLLDRRQREWTLEARDAIHGREVTLKTRSVVNCAGMWADGINAAFDIEAPYRHVLSKGVYAAFPLPEGHDATLVFEMGEHGDVLTSVPWGPVALWGPTETAIDDLSADFKPNTDDLRFLIEHRRQCLNVDSDESHIVSMRYGVRSLAVRRSYSSKRYPLSLSRHYRVAVNPDARWVSTFGGKLTGCVEAATKVERALAGIVGTPLHAEAPTLHPAVPETTTFPGMTGPVVDICWSIEHELCCTLDDYLRRRTNIAQWTPRCGLGKDNRNLEALQQICDRLAGGNAMESQAILRNYRARVRQEFDDVIAAV